MPYPYQLTDLGPTAVSYTDNYWFYYVVDNMFPTFFASQWYNTNLVLDYWVFNTQTF